MAGLLYTYSVTSIQAAKRNARLHREADGGQLDMRKESLRRHGVLERVEGTRDFELLRGARADVQEEAKYLTEKKAKSLGEDTEREVAAPRTENEAALDDYKDLGGAVRRFREEKGARPLLTEPEKS